MGWRPATWCLVISIAASLCQAQENVDLDSVDLEGAGDRLATAIDSGSVAAVRRVLDGGVSPDRLVYDTPSLTWAIWDDRYYVVKLLVERGADVNLPDTDGYTPLMSAADQGNKRIVLLLLDHGADINAVELTYGMSALQSACESGDEEVFDLFLERGADFNHVDKYGGNCLEEAALYGYDKIVEKLRAKGLTSRWPLHVAAGLGDVEEVKKQLAAGAKIDQPNGDWKNTPLMFASGAGELEVVKLLARRGASLEIENAIGGGPMHLAAGADRVEIVRWLIGKGLDVNAKDTGGSTPLDWATGDAMYELLVENRGEQGEYEYDKQE
jgi:ankyrin repeat protein